MKLQNIMDILEREFPSRYAQSWDNVGLLVGDRTQEIKRVLISLDVSDAAVEHAVKEKADLILTHHPLIFRPLKTVTEQDFIARRIRALIKHDIAYYAMHTNFDIVKMADLNAKDLMLNHAQVLEECGSDEGGVFGFGRVGNLDRPVSLAEFADYIKKVAKLSHIRVYGDQNAMISRAAIASGAGKSAIADAIDKGAQVIVTGDVDYHTGIDAVAQNIAVIDAGHYGTEYCYIPYMAHRMKELFPDIEVLTEEIRQPFTIL